MYHSYVLPYCKSPGYTKVLLGRKKCFNEKDGFIHNNPGQFVICGGFTFGNNEEQMFQHTIGAFKKETGHLIDECRITHIFQENKYYILFYKIENIKEYFKLTYVSNKSQYTQITGLKWFDINKAINIFSDINNNKPCYGRIDEYINKYIKCVFKFKKLPVFEFRNFFRLHKTTKKNEQHRARLHINKYIMGRSHIDWYFKGISAFAEII